MGELIQLEAYRREHERFTRKDEAKSIADEIIEALRIDREKILKAKKD